MEIERSSLQPADLIVLRTPLLPHEVFRAWAAGHELCSMSEPLSAASLHDISTVLRRRLKELLDDPVVAEAIFIASPSLASSLEKWRDDPESPAATKTEIALVRYLSRMAARATPFGLFSGVTAGRRAPTTRFYLEPRDSYTRSTRLDNDYLFLLCEALASDPEIRLTLSFFPNDSIYHSGGRLRYVRARASSRGRNYDLVAVESTPYLEATLARAERGARLAELAQALVDDDADIELGEASDFLHELVDAQLLVSRLTPNVTGREPLESIVSVLQEAGNHETRNKLEEIHQRLSSLDQQGLGHRSDTYLALADSLRQLGSKVELARLFQIDMVKPATELTLGQNVIDELQQSIVALQRITPYVDDDPLQGFREAFIERYEDQEVSLVEALDEETGIGFSGTGHEGTDLSPLLNGIQFPRSLDGGKGSWTNRDAGLLARVERTLAHGDAELVLTDKDLDELAPSTTRPLPNSIGTLVTIDADSVEDVNAGRFKLLFEYCHGPNGAKLLGRFCHADSGVAAGVRKFLHKEEQLYPDAIVAEIVHLPEGRVGNILCRPVLRDFEITYLGVSGAPLEKQITVDDLMVSVAPTGKIVLRSRKLGREVIPRLTSAHAVDRRSLGIYRFLHDLCFEGVMAAQWDWGPLGELRFLPRVRYGRSIFARAQWLLREPELAPLARACKRAGKAKSNAELLEARVGVVSAVSKLRENRSLPRYVVVADADNELEIDFENALSVESFANLVKSRNQVVLCEPKASSDLVRGPEGRFCHELAVPFTAEAATVQQPAPTRPTSTRACVHTFAPGSEWLYFKIYCGPSSADQVLAHVAPLLRGLCAEGAADHWFFLRFGDPKWHLRVRVHGAPERLIGEVLPRVSAALDDLVRQSIVWRIQLDTYVREADRYGGPESIALAEEIFHADSDIVAQLLDLLDGDEGAEIRWRLGVRGVAALLSDFGIDDPLPSTRFTANGFAEEFHATTAFRKQLGTKFRSHREDIMHLATLDPEADEQSPFAPGLRLFRARSEKIAPLCSRLRQLEQGNSLTTPITAVCWSVIHMHLNRLIRTDQRRHEVVIYDFLRRAFESMKARRR